MRNRFIIQTELAVTLIFLLALSTITPSYAEPVQQIIIHFNQTITNANESSLHKLISQKLSSDYSLAEHSNKLRWTIRLHSKLNSQQLTNTKNELLKNKLVKNIELDMLLEKKILIHAQLNPL